MILGTVLISADAERSYKVYRYITDNSFPVRRIGERAGRVEILVSSGLIKELTAFLESNRIEYRVISKRGLPVILSALKNKIGLLAGVIVSAVIMIILSGRIFSFEVLTDNESLKESVMAVLYDEGIRAGKPVSECDLTVAERALKKKIPELSWAGISVEGNKVIVDVNEFTEKPEYTQKRLPTNLIARETGVIEKLDLNDGMLLLPVGSGVSKGDIIVSGKVVTDRVYYKNGEERHDIFKKYTRSIGTVYGSFERSVRFVQPYCKEEKVLSDDTERRYTLDIFDVTVPLFFDSSPEFSISKTEEHTLSIFGFDLPLKVNSIDLTDYSYIQRPLSKTEAEELVYRQAEAYEQNFLTDFELKNRKTELSCDENGVTLTILYSLYGQISEEVEFFIDKS